MTKENYVSGRYVNRGGCGKYKTQEEIYPCPFFETFENRYPYLDNRNYDLQRETKDWTPDQVHPNFLAPIMKSRRNLYKLDRPQPVNTLTPRSTLSLCGDDGYMPTCDDLVATQEEHSYDIEQFQGLPNKDNDADEERPYYEGNFSLTYSY